MFVRRREALLRNERLKIVAEQSVRDEEVRERLDRSVMFNSAKNASKAANRMEFSLEDSVGRIGETPHKCSRYRFWIRSVF